MLAAISAGAAHADWTKSYVIRWYEPAMYYGTKGGVTEPE